MVSRTLLNQPRRPNVQPGKFVPLSAAHGDESSSKVTYGALCEDCDVISRWLDTNQDADRSTVVEFEHHSCIAALHESYISGCHLCALLWQSLGYLRVVPQSWMTEPANPVGIRVIRDPRDLTPTTLKVIVYRTGVIEGTELVVRKKPQSPFRREEEASGCRISAYSDEARALISSWVQRCDQEHIECRRKFNGNARFPRRILDVSPPENDQIVRLVETASWTELRRYLTLSYCWGSPDGVKLTRSNMKEYASRGINVSKLPKTIKDAIQITREMGFRWLWVDSLCILQDDAEEWAREAETMPDIYQRSFLSLGALGALDKSQGLAGQRDPLIYAPCRLCQDMYGEDYYVWPVDSHYANCFEKTPLHDRGWVVQERLLSPRTVNFGASIVWECREATWDEYGFHNGKSANLLQRKFRPSSLEREASAPSRWREVSTQPSKSFMYAWFQFVQNFSKTKFSRMSDRPIALGGICRMIQDQTGWQYSMGLWVPFIYQQLLWSCDNTGPGTKPFPDIPTWSWLCRRDPILVPVVEWALEKDVNIMAPFQSVEYEKFGASLEPRSRHTMLKLFGCIVPIIDLQRDSKRVRERISYDSMSGRRDGDLFLPLLDGKKSIAGLIVRPSIRQLQVYERVGVLETYLSPSTVLGLSGPKEVLTII